MQQHVTNNFLAKLATLGSEKIFEVGFFSKTKPKQLKPDQGLSISQTN